MSDPTPEQRARVQHVFADQGVSDRAYLGDIEDAEIRAAIRHELNRRMPPRPGRLA